MPKKLSFSYYGFNGIFKNEDIYYEFDETRINNLKINTTNTTWLASRNISPGHFVYIYISLYCFDNSGSVDDTCLYSIFPSHGFTHGYSASNGLRPVFINN